ncbi:MAG: hypothetical protein WD208_00080 [Dehalococcoidia bacterium]
MDRFAAIANLMERNRISTRQGLIDVVRKTPKLREDGGTLGHGEVILRHARVMEGLGMLTLQQQEGWILSGTGRGVVALSKRNECGDLTESEQVAFLRTLVVTNFGHVWAILEALSNATEDSMKIALQYASYIVQFVHSSQIQQVEKWVKSSQESGKAHRSLTNKVFVLSRWLEQLDLLLHSQLTASGRQLKEELLTVRQQPNAHSFEVTTKAYASRNSRISYPADAQDAATAIKEAAQLLKGSGARRSGLRAINFDTLAIVVGVTLAKRGIWLEKDVLETMIKRYPEQMGVRSASRGRAGTLSQVTLATESVL